MGFSIGKINNITMTTEDGANIIFENIVDCDLTMNGDSINNNNYYNWVMSQDFIFSLMYSPSINPSINIEEQIIQIDTKELVWANDKKMFYYIWGWPGPDFNTYTMQTYGHGWALTKDEIINTWKIKEKKNN